MANDILSTLFGAPMNLPNMPQVQNPNMMSGISLQGGMGAGGFDSGPMGGQAFNNQQDALSRSFRDNDLQYANAQNAYEQNLKNNPAIDAARDLAMKQMGLEGDMYNNGTRKEQAMSSANKDIAENSSKMSDAKLKELQNHGNGMHEINEVVKASPDFLNDKTAQAQVHSIAKKAGIDNVPETFTADDVKHINSWGQGAENGVAFRNHLAAQAEGYKQQVGVTNAAAGKGMLEVHQETELLKAKAQAAINAELRYMTLPEDQKIFLQLRQDLEAGKPLDQTRLMQLRSVVGKDPHVADALKSLNDESVQNRLLAEKPETLRTIAIQLGLLDPKAPTSNNDTLKLSSLIAPVWAKKERAQIVENQIAQVVGPATILRGDKSPAHYEEVKNGNYKLVDGPGASSQTPASSAPQPRSSVGGVDGMAMNSKTKKLEPVTRLPDGTIVPRVSAGGSGSWE